jgi:phage terminase large subunit
MQVKATNVFQRNWKAKTRLIVNRGSSRSSKTYSICQKYILKLVNEKDKVLTITRKTTPSLKTSVMMDFFEILGNWNLYNPKNHNKTELTYLLNGNLIQFTGLDNPQKKRGSKRNYLWMNEANEFNLEDYRQLAMRTTEEITLDFNPSDEFHWIYDEVLTRIGEVTEIHSTYKDNPFLEQSIIDEIENYKNIDENYWRIYGLGERGVSGATIYSNYEYVDELPETYDREVFGIDWGFNHPTCVIQCREKDGTYYVNEFYSKSKKTSSEFIEEMKAVLPMNAEIIADSEDPNRINEMYYAGWRYIKPVLKGAGSVKRGIEKIKSNKIHITKTSTNLIKEIRSYKWKVDRDGRVSDNEPVKINDDNLDAMRYGLDYIIQNAKGGKIYTRKPTIFR